MSLISINPAHAGDAHYRYQMERLRVKSDGRAGSGGGRSTELVNLVDVSRNVRRSPELLLAFLARRTGTTGRCSRKSGVEAHALKGHFAPDALQRHVVEFCERLVVCPGCGDCGTRVYAKGEREGAKKKRGALTIRMSCGACGWDGETAEQDARLAKICQDRAPAPGGEFAAAAPGNSTEMAKGATGDAVAETTKGARGDGDDSDAQKLAKYEKKLAKAEKKEGADAAAIAEIKRKVEKYATRLRAKTGAQGTGSEGADQTVAKDESDDDVEWFTDVSPEAVEARRVAALGE